VQIHRRALLQRATAALGAFTAIRLVGADALLAQSSPQNVPAPQKPPPLAPELVKDFVVAAHTKIDVVKQMLADEPRLINATWDWGGGDFETALGGASHMGRPDIATFLLAAGARMDLFCATMMGKSDVVKACIADAPAIVHVKGPHGISLPHATMGKQDAIAALLTNAGAS
jgi:hypothetical protein